MCQNGSGQCKVDRARVAGLPGETHVDLSRDSGNSVGSISEHVELSVPWSRYWRSGSNARYVGSAV